MKYSTQITCENCSIDLFVFPNQSKAIVLRNHVCKTIKFIAKFSKEDHFEQNSKEIYVPRSERRHRKFTKTVTHCVCGGKLIAEHRTAPMLIGNNWDKDFISHNEFECQYGCVSFYNPQLLRMERMG